MEDMEKSLMNKLEKGSNSTKDIAGIRMELVKKYRKEIIDKTYKIKSVEIASKMAKELFNGKSPASRINFKA
ncbi:MAG: hypothetical protein IEMM0002_0755 [bacterium]|nr:MAG: hypothetical protein IEMM0002_0755 [bacterium]